MNTTTPLSPKVKEALTHATNKALATVGPHGVNVVPVSMIRVNGDSIWLFDFFMNKTVSNVTDDPKVALVAWSDTTGVQIKAKATYLSGGDDFETAVAWVKTQNPERVVHGLLILKPTAIFDISPDRAFSDIDLAL